MEHFPDLTDTATYYRQKGFSVIEVGELEEWQGKPLQYFQGENRKKKLTVVFGSDLIEITDTSLPPVYDVTCIVDGSVIDPEALTPELLSQSLGIPFGSGESMGAALLGSLSKGGKRYDVYLHNGWLVFQSGNPNVPMPKACVGLDECRVWSGPGIVMQERGDE